MVLERFIRSQEVRPPYVATPVVVFELEKKNGHDPDPRNNPPKEHRQEPRQVPRDQHIVNRRSMHRPHPSGKKGNGR